VVQQIFKFVKEGFTPKSDYSSASLHLHQGFGYVSKSVLYKIPCEDKGYSLSSFVYHSFISALIDT